jgi:hypothetical protein
VLPDGRVVGRELVLGADERPEQVVVAERRERDAIRCADDLDPALGGLGDPGGVDLKISVVY